MSLQMLGTMHSCRIRWLFPQHAAQTPSMERWSFFLVLCAIKYFFYDKTTLFIKDALTRTSCCTFRWRQGHTGGVITSAKLPAGSSVAMIWSGLCCEQGIRAVRDSPTAGVDVQHRLATLTQFHCYVDHWLFHVLWTASQVHYNRFVGRGRRAISLFTSFHCYSVFTGLFTEFNQRILKSDKNFCGQTKVT